MPTFTIETPSGKRLKIEANDEATAMAGAEQWHDDTDAVVRTVWGEARADPDSQAGVASVILNRAKATGSAPRDVVMAKGQFEPWGNAQTRAKLEGLDPRSPEYQAILERVQPVLGGEDVTGGATHFYAPKAQAALGRKPPKWDDGSGVDMGQHRFFSRPGDFGGAPEPEVSAEVEGRPELGTGTSYAKPKPPVALPRVPPKPPQRKDQTLGLQKGLLTPLDNAAKMLEGGLRNIGVPTDRINSFLGMPSAAEAEADHAAHIDAQAKRGVVPGELGEFSGNVLGTAWIPGGPLVSGVAAGGLLSNAETPKGVLADMVLGGVAGKLGDKAVRGIGAFASNALGKLPKVMSLPELEAAKNAAYKAVDDAGYTFPTKAARDAATSVEAFLAKKGGKTLYKDAAPWVARFRQLANQKGGLPLSQLDDLRGDVYTALVKPGGKDSVIGSQLRQEIDKLISTAADENALIRTARELNSRYAKANVVTKRLDSADLARGRAYTGKNADNTIRQKLSPLIDPMHSARLRNATPDEAKALRTAVTGSPLQNRLRDAGALLDPRGLIGASVQTGLGIKSGGLTLPSIALGVGGTAAANRLSQKNVENLLRVIAVGGSKQGLARLPTPTSRAAQATVEKARPALVAGTVPLLAAARKDDDKRKKPAAKRPERRS